MLFTGTLSDLNTVCVVSGRKHAGNTLYKATNTFALLTKLANFSINNVGSTMQIVV
jgi:hypothetical protein